MHKCKKFIGWFMEFRADLYLLNRTLKLIKLKIMKTTLMRIVTILLMTGFIFSARAQEMEVSGTVFDEQDKSPIIGATVTIKGTNSGTVSDIDGKYRIKTEKG